MPTFATGVLGMFRVGGTGMCRRTATATTLDRTTFLRRMRTTFWA